MKKKEFKTLPMRSLVLGIRSDERMKQKKTVLTLAKLPSLLQKCCQNNISILWYYIFLADSMRFD